MAIEKTLRGLSRSELRYRLYRIKNKIEIDPLDGVKEYFEGQDEFDGWHNFTKTWDVGEEAAWPNGHWLAIKRHKSMEQEWNEVLARVAQDFSDKGDDENVGS